MTMIPRFCRHPAQAYLPKGPNWQYFDLAEGGNTYAVAAIAEHADCLELHLEVLRYGPRAARALKDDVGELKALAQRLGKRRVVGLTQVAGQEVDMRWFKFALAYGFETPRLYQSVELRIDSV